MLWVILIPALVIIVFQDWKYREIHLFPILLVLISVYQIYDPNWQKVLINISFLSVQLIFLTIYFSIKHRQLINLTQNHLGWGDIILLIAAVFFLHPINFILFIIIGLIISILLHLSLAHKYDEHDTVPLVSYLGIVFVLTLCVDQIFSIQLAYLPILSL